ncbi:tetrahydrofolate dehydrogenase/cyclohydrolase [Baffinella frigidus]|nr:tetrahydrofolate dehydrogenase/cyclohydrolase [Cryptophyta sp. CCMP2293]
MIGLGAPAAAAAVDNKIDGKLIAEGVKEEVRLQALALKGECGQAPCLAVVIIGERKDSQVYVRNKVAACEKCGIVSVTNALPEDASAAVRALNEDPSVHAILVQLPLPPHLDSKP